MGLCEGCHAGCCRSFAIPLTGADILRMERDLNASFWDFACRWADPEGIIARKYAPHFHFADEPETPFVISLMHEESQHFTGTSKCQHLVEGAPDAEHACGQSHCGIYESRPAACRVFPTKLNTTSELVVVYSVPERGRVSDSPIYDLCPRQWEPSDVDSLTMLPDLVVAKYEMSFFHSVAAIWNRDPQAWDVFPEFLHAVYANRIIDEATEAAAQEEAEGPSTIPMVPLDDVRRTRAA
jgi:Fe-S-cluster containining protein